MVAQPGQPPARAQFGTVSVRDVEAAWRQHPAGQRSSTDRRRRRPGALEGSCSAPHLGRPASRAKGRKASPSGRSPNGRSAKKSSPWYASAFPVAAGPSRGLGGAFASVMDGGLGQRSRDGSRAVTASQLGRPFSRATGYSGELPAIVNGPLHFEDALKIAKTRVARRDAERRKGGVVKTSSYSLMEASQSISGLGQRPSSTPWQQVAQPVALGDSICQGADGDAFQAAVSGSLGRRPNATEAPPPDPGLDSPDSRGSQPDITVSMTSPHFSGNYEASSSSFSAGPRLTRVRSEGRRGLPPLLAHASSPKASESRSPRPPPSPTQEDSPNSRDREKEMEEEERRKQRSWQLNTMFNRFKVPGEPDLHVDDVPELLKYLGHSLIDHKEVTQIIKKITVYDYMDFSEFLTFMEMFEEHEQEAYRMIFESYDEDGTGTLSTSELRPMLLALGFIPRHVLIEETMPKVDIDCDGHLDYAEMRRFLVVYQENQCFTQDELAELKRHFDFFAQEVQGEIVIKPAEIAEVLRLSFGQQEKANAQPFIQRLEGGGPSALGGAAAVPAPSSGGYHAKDTFSEMGTRISFDELLIIARMMREAEFKRLRAENPKLIGATAVAAEDPSSRRKTAPASLSIASALQKASRMRTSAPRSPRSPGSPSASPKPDSPYHAPPREEYVTEMNDFLMRFDVVEGCASYDSIRDYLQRRGYSPLKQVIVEILQEVHPDWRNGVDLDACQLYDFMLVFNKRDGWSKQQFADLLQVFDDFDKDNSKEINVLELSKMLRYLGYGLNTPEAHTIILQVDENESGQLDLREFLRMMRLMREAECGKIKEVFNSCADPKGRLPGGRVEEALEMLKHDPPDKKEIFYEAFSSLDFDDFIGVVDSARAGFVKKERKKAGFTEEELQYFQHVYTSCDKDGNGIMSALELLEVLNEFGWAPTTKEEQAVLIGRMHEAKTRAEDAGITGLKGDEMNFWVYVQLLRLLHDEQDRLQEEKNQELQAELKFSELEVDQFRQVFRGYARKNENFTTSLDSRQSAYILSGSAMKRVIHSLGVQMSGALEEKLEKKMTSLIESSVLELDFSSFLRLMRWLLDTNFGRINDVVVSKPEGDD